ncbi:MAG: hypothetical protein PHS02_03115 [Candidatus ainarchaeum sp.]|nr:hypothetical protein [Candidatus ainarchaeum sp.]
MPESKQLDVESKQHLIYLQSLSIFPRSERLALIEESLQEPEFAKPRNQVLRFLGLGYAMEPERLLSGMEMKLHPGSAPMTVDNHLDYLFSLRIFDNEDREWAQIKKEACIQAWLNFVEMADDGKKIEAMVCRSLGLDELNPTRIVDCMLRPGVQHSIESAVGSRREKSGKENSNKRRQR